jgi:lipoprotein-anchoring transpeptidase ErfK/SrfK
MKVRILIGALALSLAASVSAEAETPADAVSKPATVPTVTIINKAPSPAEPAPPALTVSPGAPDKPAASDQAAAPARPAEPATAGAPEAARSATIEPARPASIDETRAAAPDKGLSVPAPAPAVRPATPEPAAATAEPLPPPEPTLTINIDLTRQVMTVSEHGALKYTWKVSSARYGYRTPTGTFNPSWMSKMWYSRQYEYAPMPHAIFFHKGVAIHATYATRMLGTPASHGCVRLAPKNAAALYKLVGQHGKARTEIVVHGTPDHSSARLASDDYDDEMATRRSGYRYLPPSYYGRRAYSAYDGPPPGYYYVKPRQRRYYAAPRRYYQPRGLYNSYSYGYGF